MSEQDQPVVDPFAVPETTDAASAEAETSDAAPDAAAIASEFVADEVTADDVLIDEAQAEVEADVVAEAQEIVDAVGTVDAGAADAGAADAGAADSDAEAENNDEEVDPAEAFRSEMRIAPGDWYVVHSYSGYENKVKGNIEARTTTLNMEDYIFQVEVPMEEV
ncbi:MAG: transcription termination/antitermination NusG family protein, partial [Actinomycetota bacterium]|nr:transcription termination/antitermination NusG family protein [Actinomycetota bacterium]